MFTKNSMEDYKKSGLGFEQKTLVWGEKTLMAEFQLEAGGELPLHKHPHEQIGYLVSGHIRLSINGEIHDTHPGDSWVIGENLEHGAEVLKDSVAIEVFSPVREDYLP